MAGRHNRIKPLSQTCHAPNEAQMGCTILMAGAQMQQLGITAAEHEEFYKDLKCPKLCKKSDMEASEEGADFEMMGIGLLGLAKSLSGHGSRGGNGAYHVNSPGTMKLARCMAHWNSAGRTGPN